jgi:SWI/SNF-related matrix-associated actin-dependent regulator 1 of chromatin subfamily A
MITLEQIEKLARWGKQKEVPTYRGPRLCRRAKDTPEMAALWAKHGKELYAMGIVRQQIKGTNLYELKWWSQLAPEIVLARQQSISASSAADADLDIPVPPGLAYLGYQKAGIHYASQREGTLIADEMGLGKTIQAIGLINYKETIHRALIICPAHLKIKWFRELKKWLVRKQSVGIADGSCFPSTDIVVINFQILPRHPKSLEFFWDLVVVDEAHELRNPQAQRSKAVLGYRPTPKERKRGMQPSSGIPAKYRVMLSGTPMANKPLELYPLLRWLAPKTFAVKTDFAKRYCGYDPVTHRFNGSSHEQELGEYLRSICMVRRLKKDVLKELPAKRREVIELPASKVCQVSEESRALAAFMDDLSNRKAAVELAKASGDRVHYQRALDSLKLGLHEMNQAIAIIRRQTAMAKIPVCIEHIRPLLDEGNKLIIFGYHREAILEYHRSFAGSVMIRGGMSDREKMQACDTFQNNDACRVIVGNMGAMGTGLDLTAGNLVIFTEESWLPLEISQCEDRAHRLGQTNSVFVQHLVLEGSIDCRMAYRTIQKQEMFEQIMDGKSREDAMAEPIIPMPEGVSVNFSDYEREAQALTEEQICGIRQAVKLLQSAKLNLIDQKITEALAGLLNLTRHQAVLGKQIVRQYWQQIDRSLAQMCLGSESAEKPIQAGPRMAIIPPQPRASVGQIELSLA